MREHGFDGLEDLKRRAKARKIAEALPVTPPLGKRRDDGAEAETDGDAAAAAAAARATVQRGDDDGEREDDLGALRDLQTIYALALHELMRQVSAHCGERGALLVKLYKFHFLMFQRLLLLTKQMSQVDFKAHARTFRSEYQDRRATLDGEVSALREQYETEVKQGEAKADEWRSEIANCLQQIEAARKESIWYKNQEETMVTEVKTLRELLEAVEKRSASLQGEFRDVSEEFSGSLEVIFANFRERVARLRVQEKDYRRRVREKVALKWKGYSEAAEQQFRDATAATPPPPEDSDETEEERAAKAARDEIAKILTWNELHAQLPSASAIFADSDSEEGDGKTFGELDWAREKNAALDFPQLSKSASFVGRELDISDRKLTWKKPRTKGSRARMVDAEGAPVEPIAEDTDEEEAALEGMNEKDAKVLREMHRRTRQARSKGKNKLRRVSKKEVYTLRQFESGAGVQSVDMAVQTRTKSYTEKWLGARMSTGWQTESQRRKKQKDLAGEQAKVISLTWQTVQRKRVKESFRSAVQKITRARGAIAGMMKKRETVPEQQSFSWQLCQSIVHDVVDTVIGVFSAIQVVQPSDLVSEKHLMELRGEVTALSPKAKRKKERAKKKAKKEKRRASQRSDASGDSSSSGSDEDNEAALAFPYKAFSSLCKLKHVIRSSMDARTGQIRIQESRPIAWLMRTIMQVYEMKASTDEDDDRAGKKRQSMPDFLYDFLFFKYGLRDLTELNLIELLDHVMLNRDKELRAFTFGRFAWLYDPLPQSALTFYLHILQLVKKHCEGRLIVNGETGKTHVSLRGMIAAVEEAFAGLDEGELEEVLDRVRRLERVESLDTKGIMVVDIEMDRALQLALDKWESYDNLNIRSLHIIFQAGNYDQTGWLTYEAFRACIKEVKPNATDREVTEMFGDEHDSLDWDQFLTVCRAHDLLYFRPDERTLQEDAHAQGFFEDLASVWVTRKVAMQAQLQEIDAASVGEDLVASLRQRIQYVDWLFAAKRSPVHIDTEGPLLYHALRIVTNELNYVAMALRSDAAVDLRHEEARAFLEAPPPGRARAESVGGAIGATPWAHDDTPRLQLPGGTEKNAVGSPGSDYVRRRRRSVLSSVAPIMPFSASPMPSSPLASVQDVLKGIAESSDEDDAESSAADDEPQAKRVETVATAPSALVDILETDEDEDGAAPASPSVSLAIPERRSRAASSPRVSVTEDADDGASTGSRSRASTMADGDMPHYMQPIERRPRTKSNVDLRPSSSSKPGPTVLKTKVVDMTQVAAQSLPSVFTPTSDSMGNVVGAMLQIMRWKRRTLARLREGKVDPDATEAIADDDDDDGDEDDGDD